MSILQGVAKHIMRNKGKKLLLCTILLVIIATTVGSLIIKSTELRSRDAPLQPVDAIEALLKAFEKKQVVFKSPDMSKLQEVVIDVKTKIYIALDADPEEARSRYWARIDAKNRLLISPKKAVVSQ